MAEKRIIINLSGKYGDIKDVKKCVEDIAVIFEMYCPGGKVYAQTIEMLTPCCGANSQNEDYKKPF